MLADQFTKTLVIQHLPLHTSFEVIPGFFNIVHVHNTGIAFSMLAGKGSGFYKFLFIGIAIAVIVFLNIAVAKTHSIRFFDILPLGLILGGAVGNMIDRIKLGFVVDFLDFYIASYHWPAFNIADSAITVGAILIVIGLFKSAKT